MSALHKAYSWLRENYRRPKVVVSIGILLVVVGGFISTRSGGKISYEEIAVAESPIEEAVSVTAKVKAARDISLAFERGGKVSSVNVRVGARVGAGAVLAALENTSALADVRQAEANLKIEQVKLNELNRGMRPEELRVTEIKRDNAIIARDDARRSSVDVIQSSYTKVEDAVRNKLDTFYTNPRTSSPHITLTLGDSSLTNKLEFGRVSAEQALMDWKKLVDATTATSDMSAAIHKSEQYADVANALLQNMALAVNSLSPYGSISQTTIDSWKASVALARTNVDTGMSALVSADNAYKSAESAVALAEQELALARAGATGDQIATQEARVLSASAALLGRQAEYEKTIIRAPISGIVTKREVEPGEIASANTLAIGLIGESEEELEAAIPEVDVAKITVGDKARVELDAFPGEMLEARVVSVDPSETLVSGIATYTTRLQFIKQDPRVRSGMTTSTIIVTDARERAIVIPLRAVLYRDGNPYVLIKNGVNPEERSITLGIKDLSGNVEVNSGLRTGEVILRDNTK